MADDGLLVRVSAEPARPRAGEAPGGKRAVIVRAATALFLRQGYQSTSTEQIASSAGVSKQTVYNQFGDKESLFREIVLGVTATAEAFAAEVTGALAAPGTSPGLDAALRALAHRYLAVVMTPQVLALRRMIIGEATRFPELAATYHDRAPARVLAALAAGFARLAEQGLLTVPDPDRAAADFAFLLLGRPLDEGMFHTDGPVMPDEAIEAAAGHAVDVFLAAYRPAG